MDRLNSKGKNWQTYDIDVMRIVIGELAILVLIESILNKTLDIPES
jgi:hypothetical protein